MKTHRRLAQFATKDEHDRLHGLPEFAFERAERLWTEAKDAKDERKARNFAQSAKLHEAALALAILCVNPMRRENLASLELDRHFLRDHRGRIVHLLIPATEVKNRRIIDAKIEKALAKRIDRHLKTFRPFIRDHEKSTALFPGPDGKPRVPNTLARKVTRLVESQLGADFTVHLMRHLFVETVLKDNPNNIGLAQRGLGHTRQKTTEEMYGARSTGAALAIHAKILEERGKPGKVKSGVGERRLRYG
jgi:integrase